MNLPVVTQSDGDAVAPVPPKTTPLLASDLQAAEAGTVASKAASEAVATATVATAATAQKAAAHALLPTLSKLHTLPTLDAPATPSLLPVIETPPMLEGGEALVPNKRSLRWLWISLLVLAGLILAVYIGFSLFFMSHFTFNTTVNGVNVAFQSAEEVDGYLASEIGSYTLEVVGRNNQNGVVRGRDISLVYVADGQMASKVESQVAWVWPLTLLPGASTAIDHVNVSYSAKQLEAALSALAALDEEQMKLPVDAQLTFEGNAYTITPADEGTTLDVEKTKQTVAHAIDEGKTLVNLDEEGLYLAPAVRADNPELVATRDRFNTYVPFRVIYTLGDRREVLDGTTTMNWVNTEGAAPYALNTDAVWAWVADFASRYDTLGKTRTIVNGFGEEKTVAGGTYGWQVDQEAEFNAIMNAATQRLGEEREPYLLGSAASLDAQDWGTTYAEVDMTQQHMWYFVNGVLSFESDVVTGNPNTGYGTPEGVYSVMYKQAPSILRGPRQTNGEFEWETQVSWWMLVTPDGCGFHDATWQSSFGGQAYTWRGSHGCINMPYDNARTLYEILAEGTPVIFHY